MNRCDGPNSWSWRIERIEQLYDPDMELDPLEELKELYVAVKRAPEGFLKADGKIAHAAERICELYWTALVDEYLDDLDGWSCAHGKSALIRQIEPAVVGYSVSKCCKEPNLQWEASAKVFLSGVGFSSLKKPFEDLDGEFEHVVTDVRRGLEDPQNIVKLSNYVHIFASWLDEGEKDGFLGAVGDLLRRSESRLAKKTHGGRASAAASSLTEAFLHDFYQGKLFLGASALKAAIAIALGQTRQDEVLARFVVQYRDYLMSAGEDLSETAHAGIDVRSMPVNYEFAWMF